MDWKKENNADVQIRNAKKTFKPDLMQWKHQQVL